MHKSDYLHLDILSFANMGRSFSVAYKGFAVFLIVVVRCHRSALRCLAPNTASFGIINCSCFTPLICEPIKFDKWDDLNQFEK